MSFNDIIDDAYRTGGKWLKLTAVGDRAKGTLVNIDKRDKRDLDGNIVTSRKTGNPRIEWVLTLATDLQEAADDDGIRKMSANESIQSAIKEAIKRAGIKNAEELEGAQIAIQLVAEARDKFSQAAYTAQIKAEAPKKPVNLDDLFD